MTHKKEIQRWSKTSDGTGVWFRNKSNGEWALLQATIVGWHDWCIYIVDDEYAELRKAEADGKTIQLNNKDKAEWTDWPEPMYSENIINYRIKPEDIYYYQWEKLDKENEEIIITPYYTDKKANYNGYQVNAGWRKIESSKRTWN